MRTTTYRLSLIFIFLSSLLCANSVSVARAYSIDYDSLWLYRSQSMFPTLVENDYVYIKNITGQADINASYSDGDIILFPEPPNPSMLIIHRAVEKFQQNNTWYFKAKGDNNTLIDPWDIPEKDVIGKAVALSRVCQVDSHNVTIFSNAVFTNVYIDLYVDAFVFNVTTLLSQSAPNSFANVTIPNEMLGYGGINWVWVNGTNVQFDQSYDTTNHYVSFDYGATNCLCYVNIPEYLSLVILPAFMLATLLAVIAYKRMYTRQKLARATVSSNGFIFQ